MCSALFRPPVSSEYVVNHVGESFLPPLRDDVANPAFGYSPIGDIALRIVPVGRPLATDLEPGTRAKPAARLRRDDTFGKRGM